MDSELRHKKAWREIAKVPDCHIRNALFSSDDESILGALNTTFPKCFTGSSLLAPRRRLLADLDALICSDDWGQEGYEPFLAPLHIPIILSWYKDDMGPPVPKALEFELLSHWNPYNPNPLLGSLVFHEGLACMVIEWDGWPYFHLEAKDPKLMFALAKNEFFSWSVTLIPAACINFSE